MIDGIVSSPQDPAPGTLFDHSVLTLPERYDGFCTMLPLSHYSPIGEGQPSVPFDQKKEQVWDDLCSNLLVVGKVVATTKSRVEVLLDKALGTSKTHLHQLADYKIFVHFSFCFC